MSSNTELRIPAALQCPFCATNLEHIPTKLLQKGLSWDTPFQCGGKDPVTDEPCRALCALSRVNEFGATLTRVEDEYGELPGPLRFVGPLNYELDTTAGRLMPNPKDPFYLIAWPTAGKAISRYERTLGLC